MQGIVLIVNWYCRVQATVGAAIPREVVLRQQENWLSMSECGSQPTAFLHGLSFKFLLELLPWLPLVMACGLEG